jgi:chromosomal replication initiation ATPase DnaA
MIDKLFRLHLKGLITITELRGNTIAFSDFYGEYIEDIDQKLLNSLKDKFELTPQELIGMINKSLGINVMAKTRKREYVKGRAMCMKILREEKLMTYGQIGKIFNKKHETVMHAIKALNNLLELEIGVWFEYAVLLKDARKYYS